jgi:hypothetical protein
MPDTVAANFAGQIYETCCQGGGKALSGMAFSYEGWNVDVGYANCHHPAEHEAPGNFKRPYVNGECRA